MGHLKPEEVAEIGFTLAVLDQNEDGLRRKSGSGFATIHHQQLHRPHHHHHHESHPHHHHHYV